MENGFSEDTDLLAAAPPNEWIDPHLWAFTDAKSGLVGNARQRAALEFSEPLTSPTGDMTLTAADTEKEVPRFAYIRTRAHPGATAPLGWTLSKATIDDLAAQLGQNNAEFTLVREWLAGDLVCANVS